MGRTKGRRFASLLVFAAATIALAGCATSFTGGGTINSADGNAADQANFGFNYKVTDPSGSGHAQGTYHDVTAGSYWPNGGVMLKFDGLLKASTYSWSLCAVAAGNSGVDGELSYVSQNPAYPGSGTLHLQGCDNGQPGSNDWIWLYVDSGPYMGYGNGGTLTGGNLKGH